jgi:hypothetical protein
MRRELNGFYVLCTAVALKIAKGKKVWRFVVALILAERVDGSQWAMGQKGIDMANLHDHRNAQTKLAAVCQGLVRARVTHFATNQTPLKSPFRRKSHAYRLRLKALAKNKYWYTIRPTNT